MMTTPESELLSELTAILGDDPVGRAKALAEPPKCSQPGCGSKLAWRRTGGEWTSEKRGNAAAIRCLECGSVLCPHHAQQHFDESVAVGRKREQEEVLSLRSALRSFLASRGREHVLDYQLVPAFNTEAESAPPLAEKDALLAELTDADDWLRQLLAACRYADDVNREVKP